MSAIARRSSNDGRKQVDYTQAGYVHAYISVVSDACSVTVTAHHFNMDAITTSLSEHGMSTKTLALIGSYHNHENEPIATKVNSALDSAGYGISLQGSFAPVRSNSTGEIMNGSDAFGCIIDDIFCRQLDWHNTVSEAADSAPASSADPATTIAFGTVEYFPSVIKSRFKVTAQRLSVPEVASPSPVASRVEPTLEYPYHAVADVALACGFPRADGLDQFGNLLSSGRSMHERMPAHRFATTGLRRSNDSAPFWGHFMKDVDAFDHQFFKKSSREAASMDPQQRLLLQCAYTAMESAGHLAPTSGAKTRNVGVYIGACSNDYNDNFAPHKPTACWTLCTLEAFLTGSISHYFDWTGPSIIYETACSSSAVAIDAVCKAIASGECSQAPAGGVSFTGPCKPFDASADEYCRGEGAGLVVLKGLKAALADGDDIRFVIASTGVI
ncbi:polyketide synthase-like protein [Dothistroma septosporum NZE10]|uniref:Polyketide synthase-like protein n=1 Tax=Dothistroma septosporum (strain NZE10 / CBS 128990) TaxID=675120 RepID=N1PN24_DOTSN|nr:polyketide synthase-like protein [Dothistroma septosporum NZE10]